MAQQHPRPASVFSTRLVSPGGAGFLVLATVFTTLVAPAQEYMPPDRPPPADFQVQGEYFGAIEGGGNLGAWVVGQGGDKYNVVFLPGGLLEMPGQPGGGWNKTVRHNGTGSAASLATANGFKAAITGTGEARVMKGTTSDNKPFTLNRVVRKGPTQGLKPKAEWNASWWFRENTAGDLAKWSPRPDVPQLKYGGFLLRGVTSKETHTTVFLHIEVRSPYCPSCRDQSRGNSGIYLRGMHEMQVLDSFGLTGADNELGSIYRVKAPAVNAALPPLTWQTYDCYYTPGTGNTATMTVYLNGVLVQDKTLVPAITEAGFSGNSLYLQNHGNEVIYNNIWAIPGATETTFPYAALLSGVTGADPSHRINAPASRRPVLSLFGVEGGHDLAGRKVARSSGAVLLARPVNP